MTRMSFGMGILAGLAIGAFAACTNILGDWQVGDTGSGGGTGTGGMSATGSGGMGTGGGSGTGGQPGTGGMGTGGMGTGGMGTGGMGTGGMAGTGGTAGGACTNAADLAIIQDPSSMVADKVGACGQQNLGQEPATKDCIIQQTGLSDGCATCFDATVGCTVQKCLTQCISDPGSTGCTCCRQANCQPAFDTCSGLPPEPPPDGGCP